VVPVDLDDLTAHAAGDLAQLALLVGRGLRRLECWPVFDRKILVMRYHEFKWRQGCGGRLSRLDGDALRHRRDCRPKPNGCRQHNDGDARTSYFAHDCRSWDGEISQPDVHDAHYRLRAVAFSCKARSSRSIAVCQPGRAARYRSARR
jgi:hypothetical protein